MDSTFQSVLDWHDVLLRLLLAAACGGLIGFERERHGRAAGLRTNILVCVAATLAMILSGFLFIESNPSGGSWKPDPARLAAGILTGMGFLGGGAIIREGNMVRGVTTAAALWFVTILGLAFGSGHLVLGLTGWGIAMVTLLVLAKLESSIPHDWYGSLIVTTELSGIVDTDLRARIESHHVTVKDIDIEVDMVAKLRTVRCTVKYKRADTFDLAHRLIDDLVNCQGVRQVKWA